MSRGAFNRLVTDPPKSLTPFIKHAPYPDVLVARAIGHSTGLSCVLVPGRGAVMADITIAGLQPFVSYSVQGAGHLRCQADHRGEVALKFKLQKRTAIEISKTTGKV